MDQYQIQNFLTSGLKLGRISGIEIRLHFLMLVFLLFSPWIMNLPLPYALCLSVLLFGSVLLHELGHCYGARLVGGYANQIILWPLGGMALISGAEKSPRAELIVTVLGPLVSVLLALLGWAVYWLLQPLLPFSLLTVAVLYFAAINTMLALFNLLLPLFPMDSARIVRAALSFYMHPNRVTYYLCTFGMYLGGAVALFGLFGNQPILTLIGVFGGVESYQERLRAQVMPVYLEETYFYSDQRLGLFEWIFGGLKRWRPRRRAKNKTGARIVEVRVSGFQSARTADPLEQLHREMSAAVAREDFREAARLRDKIKNFTG